MATQLILTVGKNPLPVWVAWDRLTNLWRDQGQNNVAVQFVYTEGTKDEKKLLKDYCLEADMNVLNDILTSQRNPNQQHICGKIVQDHQPQFTNLHLHYTGGTQAMGVATVCAMLLAKNTLLTDCDRKVSIDASYLDPGRGSAPMIVSWTRDPLIEDTRVGVTADIQKIAGINGFQAGGFKSADPPYTCPTPQTPSAQQLSAGQAVLNHIRDFDDIFYDRRWGRWVIKNEFSQDHKDAWNSIFRPHGSNRDFVHPPTTRPFSSPLSTNNVWQEKILPMLNAAYPNCQWCTGTGTLDYPEKSTATKVEKKDLKEMDAFFNGIWLEYAAYAAFKKILEEIKCKSGGRRGNFQLFHNVYVRTQGTGTADRHFELDVVAGLGYQVVVVSCSVTSSLSSIKQKAMEVYHRAKQLGGDEARAVVLCVASYEDAERVEKELEDETGTERPLQVWGRQRGTRGEPGKVPNMDGLCAKFEKLLFQDCDGGGNPRHLYWQ